ncbi:phage tail protein [Pseudoalteromonas piscicida]|uniref:phage tail protein n=1 Tax=Pseudoalteromonas piscicida TaxID=43662 RepID=UPI000A97CA3A|nr:phage tail protein [Pseudoalteromonas piscicida]
MTNSHYWTHLTSAGRQAILDAIANDQTVEISEFGVGDGHLTPLQETLVQEKYRGAINSVKLLDTANLAEIIGVLPVGVGGFYVREAAFYMPDGRPFALVKHPETYKPSGDENAAAELKIKAVIDVENNHSVAEKIDPSLTYATREWVGDAINPHGLGTQISHQSANFFDRTFELRLGAGESKPFPDLPDTACDILIFGLTDGTATSTNFVGRFAKYGSTWRANTIYGNTNGPNHPSIKIIDNVPTFRNHHSSNPYRFSFKCWVACQDRGNAKPFEFFANTYSTHNKPTAEEIGAVPATGRSVISGSLNELSEKSEVVLASSSVTDRPFNDKAYIVEVSVVEFSGGTRVIQVAHEYATLKHSYVRYRGVDGVWSGWGAFYTEHNKPKPADISEKLDRFERSYIDTNGGQDLNIRGKRALVGATDNFYINYGADWQRVYAQGHWNFNGDITITKNNPWLTLHSSSSGNNNIEQAAGISIGESGRTNAASLHFTYTGDGRGWLGMGNLGSDSIPDNWAMQLNYQQTWVRFRSEIHLGDDKTKLSKGNSDSLRVVSPHGYVDIGPQTSTNCHYSTDLSGHQFNKPILVSGEIYAGSGQNQRVYHEGHKPSFDEVTGKLTKTLQFEKAGVLTSLASRLVDGADAWHEIGNGVYSWQLKYVGSTDGDNGNEFRVQSTKTGAYYQFDHFGNFDINGKAVYHEGYKPTASDIGGGTFPDTVFSKQGGSFSGSLVPNPNAVGLHVYSDTKQQRVGSVGVYSSDGKEEGAHAYLGLGETPWDGNKGITVSPREFKYCGQYVLHTGNTNVRDWNVVKSTSNVVRWYKVASFYASNTNDSYRWLINLAGTKGYGAGFNDQSGGATIYVTKANDDSANNLNVVAYNHCVSNTGSSLIGDLKVTSEDVSGQNTWFTVWARFGTYTGASALMSGTDCSSNSIKLHTNESQEAEPEGGFKKPIFTSIHSGNVDEYLVGERKKPLVSGVIPAHSNVHLKTSETFILPPVAETPEDAVIVVSKRLDATPTIVVDGISSEVILMAKQGKVVTDTQIVYDLNLTLTFILNAEKNWEMQ